MAMLKFWILDSFPIQTASHYAAYTTVLSVCVRWLHLLNHLTDCYN